MAVKRFAIGLILAIFMAAGIDLAGCGLPEFLCPDSGADLVFVNRGGAAIRCVTLDGERGGQGTINADESPLRAGERLHFEVGGDWPVTVTVYADAEGKAPLAEVTVPAPPEGERWYVTAVDGPGGPTLTVTAAQAGGVRVWMK